MKLDFISLKNFRNYSATKMNLNPRINIFLGDNGQGKTNLLEAVWTLMNGQTFRNSKSRDLIKFNENSLEISGEISDKFHTNQIKFAILDDKKKLELNGKKINSRSKIKKLVSTVIFDKDLSYNLAQSFKPRRDCLDSIISNLSSEYKVLIRNYNKEIKRKNETLRTTKSDELLDFIDERLIKLSNKVSLNRRLWISRIIDITNQVIKKLDNDFVINLDFNSDSIEVDKLKKALRHNRVRDKMLGNASTGSHKDKISFLVKKADIFNFGSEGEKKTVALAIKISEILILKKIEGNFPLILIDEIGNEFDQKRVRFFYNFVTKINTQCFITATSQSLLSKQNQNHALFSITNGDCIKIS